MRKSQSCSVIKQPRGHGREEDPASGFVDQTPSLNAFHAAGGKGAVLSLGLASPTLAGAGVDEGVQDPIDVLACRLPHPVSLDCHYGIRDGDEAPGGFGIQSLAGPDTL